MEPTTTPDPGTLRPPRVALLGRGGLLPFVGHFQGELSLPGGGLTLGWAGRVTTGASPEMGWRAARAVQGALARKGPIEADRRRALSVMWARLDAVARDLLGPLGGDDLVLLLCATDEEGSAISAVGVDAVFGAEPEGAVNLWVSPPHPMLGLAGLPTKRPGAVLVEVAPPWLIGSPQGVEDDPSGQPVAAVLHRCGVGP